MELRSLNRFVAVAEELHFGRAAQRLHVAESALSRQIKRLEGELGFDLFDRTNRRVQLTPAGAVFLDYVRSLVISFDVAVTSGRRTAQGKSGFLRVGFVSATLCGLVPAVLRSFRKRWPDVELELAEMTTLQQLENLRQRRIDIGFVRDPLPAETKELVFEMVARERFAVALPKKHPLAKCRRISVKSLANECFITYPSSQPISNSEAVVRRMCRKAGFELNVVQRTMQINTAISLVSTGIGIAVVPLSASGSAPREVVFRPLEGITVTEVQIAYRKDETSPVLPNFLRSAREVICGNLQKR